MRLRSKCCDRSSARESFSLELESNAPFAGNEEVAKPKLAKLGVALAPVAIVFALLYANRSPSDGDYASDQALEAALLAPCCYNGTLTTHDSEMAHDLRLEIEHRHAGGESLRHIEKDFVARYGERVMAMPNQNRFERIMSVALAAAVVGAGILLLAVRKLGRKSPAPAPSKTPVAPPARDAWDDRIDEELLADQRM